MDLQYALELVGTIVFAISGVLAVREREHDMFGAGFTGFITAIGGGTLRDILLDSYPLVWIGDVKFLYAILVGILAAFIFPNFLSRLRKTFFLFDTLGIAFFTVLGVEKALHLGVRPEIAAIMGMFSAVMGGVIRDTLTNEIPILFRKEIYASACLSGAIFYLVLNYFEVPRDINLLVSVALIIAIRLIAMRFKLSLPRLD
ncbi:trimeric intracellular cation channel family protein [Algoriphagus halophytocola]|uniref:Trimeric intracellular cation channel family protein n=1 Tax=Algoriphagus halophytocola TaxID=2991499 RepID=A0ABY6MHI4_9BACT|nr:MULTISPECIES: trimeric intracellular cation channel family protein [unclassified Algoriphagus]UZD21639.1 trimeric intracellular cation channel family protein [Algoriphagus sp. TR-M5]WBL42851.1 trimeric intracellular cation channel family protein [Algoriphagus sp. TR-M9]